MTEHEATESGSAPGETVRERIERFVRDGRLTREAVESAERAWRAALRQPVTMPNGDHVYVRLDDVYHVIEKPRLARHPERIRVAIENTFEIRMARNGRLEFLSRWEEPDGPRYTFGITDADQRLRTLMMTDQPGIRKRQRGGDVLWKQSGQPTL